MSGTRTDRARPPWAGCRCCGTARPRYPMFTHSTPTGGPGCFAPQVIKVGSPEGGRAHRLTSTVLVERLVPLSGFRKPRLGHQQAAVIRPTLALLEEHPAGKLMAESSTDFHRSPMPPGEVRTDRAAMTPGVPGRPRASLWSALLYFSTPPTTKYRRQPAAVAMTTALQICCEDLYGRLMVHLAYY
ncbi:hypothetical protein ROHU_021043 [Labeo rohita]|uniref:Uncharacterized protein n=1 Tax=Labeo rohita TaxID=84645 RepID=A0A498MVN0_LABRO|nr:hypothetical protein ROHU_021043 [Labeo rohita]